MDSPSTWEAVFFDIGGVIVDLESIQEGHRRFIDRFITEFNLEISVDTALEKWQDGVGEYFRSRSGSQFRSARDGYAHGVNELMGETVEPAEWWGIFQDATEEMARPIPEAPETIATLAETNLYLGIISDIDAAEAQRLLGLFDVRQYFDAVTTSEEAGKTKPHPVIFQTALRKASIDSQHAIMIGDRYEHDMRGAKYVELQTAAFGGSAAEKAPDPSIDYVLREIKDILEIVHVPGTN